MIYAASCVDIGGRAVLLTGRSGVGKSDVALRLIDSGARLVADDQTLLEVLEGRLVASPPSQIEGLIEIRHIGLFQLPFGRQIPVALHINLVDEKEVLARLPEPQTCLLLDHPVRCLTLLGYASSTPVKIRAALSFPCDESR